MLGSWRTPMADRACRPASSPKIVEMIQVVRQSKIARKVILQTNGRLLDRMPEDFWTALDVLYISIYPTLKPVVVPAVAERAKRYGFELRTKNVTRFSKLFGKPGQDPAAQWARCPWRKHCWTVHDGWFYLCPEGAFLATDFIGLLEGTDGVRLDGITQEQFDAYVRRSHPMESCKICDSFTEDMPWSEATSKEQWVRESAR